MAKWITRRRFFTTVGATVAGTGLYAYGIEPHRVVTVHRDLPIRNLPESLEGKSLVQISDLHIGPTDEDYLRSCFRLVNELEPELVVITGDFMTSHGTDQIPQVQTLLGDLKKPPLGIFATLGNHDYGPTWRNCRIADELAETVRSGGITLLRNEQMEVSGLSIIGLDELWAGKFEPETGLADWDPAQPSLVLSHNPDTLDNPGWGDYRGWVLSGHTHGGQCSCPFVGPPILPVKNQRYSAGEIDVGNGRRIYINRGLGYNRRVRFNVRPEITAFTLQSEMASSEHQ